jgi:hypothetical protein
LKAEFVIPPVLKKRNLVFVGRHSWHSWLILGEIWWKSNRYIDFKLQEVIDGFVGTVVQLSGDPSVFHRQAHLNQLSSYPLSLSVSLLNISRVSLLIVMIIHRLKGNGARSEVAPTLDLLYTGSVQS